MEEEEERGLTFGEICKIIFKRVWWVVGITAAVMIIALCLVQFWYNPGKQYYSAKYEVRLPSGDKYPDGTAVRLEDSVLLTNLQDIKDEKFVPEANRTGKFADLDIEKMVENDDIEFVQSIEKQEDETYKYRNNIRVSRKYFKDKEQATAFVRAVVEFPVSKAQYLAGEINYVEWLARFDKYSTYEEKINALVEQKKYIVTGYENLRSLYGGDYSPAGLSESKTIDEYLRDLTVVFDSRAQEAAYNTVSANYFVYDTETYKNNAQAKIDSLKISIDENEARIAAQRTERDRLIANGGSIQEVAEYDKIIADLTDKNAIMENDRLKTQATLTKIDAYLTDGSKDAFDTRLNGIRAELNEASQTLRSVNVATYAEKAETIYVNNKITVEGGMSIIIAAVVGALIGFIATAAVIFIIDYPKYKKAKLAALEESEDAPASGEKSVPEKDGSEQA